MNYGNDVVTHPEKHFTHPEIHNNVAKQFSDLVLLK